MLKNIIIICGILLFANMSIAMTDETRNIMENCITGSYMNGTLLYKKSSGYCMIKMIYNSGRQNEVAQVCKFPMGFYKKMMNDQKRMKASDFKMKYKNMEARYCKWEY